MSFASDLSQFEKKANQQVNQARRKTVLDLFSSIIRDTPVRTGRARANWQTSVGSVRVAALGRTDESEAQSELVAALGQWKDDTTITIANGLAYITALEDGSSKQAPHGMVAGNVKRFEPLLKAAAEQARQ